MMKMKLKAGYKQTEVGVIPNDWEIKSIEELCIPSGLVRGPFGGALKKESFVERGYKVYEQKNAIYGNVNLGTYFIDKSKFIELKRFEILKDDFILSCSGTIGKLYQIPESFEQGIINQALLKITINKKIYCDKYFFHFFVWDKFQLKIIDNTQGGAMKNLVGMPIFKATKIPIPPTKSEQTAIATALSDADALISSLEKLIEKKRNIKQGAMQQLLKPKKGWVVKKLGEICEIKKGQLITEATAVNGDIPVIAGGKKPSYFHNNANRFGKTITISGSGANAGYVAFFEVPIFASDCSTIEEAGNYSLEYLFYNLQLLQNKIYKAQTGGAQPHIHPSDLAPFEILFPDLKIQESIAETLKDMDSEIDSLEKKLSKSKQLKQGMMQELLTGKIRLV